VVVLIEGGWRWRKRKGDVVELEVRCAEVVLAEGVAGVGVILARSPASVFSGQGVQLGNALWMYSSHCVQVQNPRSSDGEIISSKTLQIPQSPLI
jgi:hypothetical protein